MRINVSFSALVSVSLIMAAVSLFVMISLNRLDFIVHKVLYNFGLVFSYRWAMPYWINSGIIIGLSWFNIVAAIVLIHHAFRGRKRLANLEVSNQQSEQTEPETETLGKRPEDFIEMQILDQYFEFGELQLKNYDVRNPEDVVDSQC